MLGHEKAEKIMGKKPINLIGTCFDSSCKQLVMGGESMNPKGTKLVHGIVTSNYPGSEGQLIAYAWLEYNSTEGVDCCIDTTWGAQMLKHEFYGNFKPKFIKEYTIEEAHQNWITHNNTGPWDSKIKGVIYDNTKRSSNVSKRKRSRRSSSRSSRQN